MTTSYLLTRKWLIETQIIEENCNRYILS